MQKLSYKSVIRALTSDDKLKCRICLLPIEASDVTIIDLDSNSILYSCPACKNTGSVTIDLENLANELGVIFALSDEDYEMTVQILLDGKQINKKEKKGKSVKEIVEDFISSGFLSCYKCNKVLTVDELTCLDIDKERFEYRCDNCNNIGFRAFKSVGFRVELFHSSIPASWNVDVKVGNKVVNKKEDVKKAKCHGCGSMVDAKEITTKTDFDFDICQKCAEILLKCKKCGRETPKTLVIEGSCIFCRAESFDLSGIQDLRAGA